PQPTSPFPAWTSSRHRNGRIVSHQRRSLNNGGSRADTLRIGRVNEKAREAFTLRALVERPALIYGMAS
ncbi:hypothetical protein FG479_31695, partial [Burkholderia pseudomallei]|nr:hypothetical protein [Burkholderia pseudomallei]